MTKAVNAVANQGDFALVSVGIGDPDNMTLRAYRTLAAADLVIGMKHVCEGLAEYLQGKQVEDAGHGLFTSLAREGNDRQQVRQREAALREKIEAAYAAGQKIVVLEFGDPFLFGPQRGYLQAFAHLNPRIVPGMSSFNAANALIERPLLGGQSRRLCMTTLAHLPPLEAEVPDLLVLFAMQMDFSRLVTALKRGYADNTPVVLVFHAGFRARQHCLRTTLGDLLQQVQAQTLPWDYLVYVGKCLDEAKLDEDQ